MQYHLNGYRPGPPAVQPSISTSADDLGRVDVLIVGAGPAGLTLAAQLSAFPEIRTLIVDQNWGR